MAEVTERKRGIWVHGLGAANLGTMVSSRQQPCDAMEVTTEKSDMINGSHTSSIDVQSR